MLLYESLPNPPDMEMEEFERCVLERPDPARCWLLKERVPPCLLAVDAFADRIDGVGVHGRPSASADN